VTADSFTEALSPDPSTLCIGLESLARTQSQAIGLSRRVKGDFASGMHPKRVGIGAPCEQAFDELMRLWSR